MLNWDISTFLFKVKDKISLATNYLFLFFSFRTGFSYYQIFKFGLVWPYDILLNYEWSVSWTDPESSQRKPHICPHLKSWSDYPALWRRQHVDRIFLTASAQRPYSTPRKTFIFNKALTTSASSLYCFSY